jgi:hypothetical protein
MKPTMFISPYDAMWREIGCLYRGLEHAREALERAVEGVGAADAERHPVPDAPSMAGLLLELGGEEAAWIHRRWRNEEPPQSWRPFLERSGKPAVPAILAWLREVREATRLKLIKASDADLDRQTIAADGGMASLRWVLHHLLDRAAFARGQIALLRAIPAGAR